MPPLSASAPDLTANMPAGNRHVERITASVYAFEWVILLVVLSYIGLRALPRAWNHLNTDFPNYYVTARLFREGYSARRVYEWVWLQRQKDRMGILPSEQPVVGFVPHTPFSAFLLWPLTYWPPLAAKHIWIICNLLLFVAVGVFLRSLTRLAWRRLALLMGLCYPALRNLEYGQYYIVILLLLTAALYLYVRDRRFASGLLVGFAAGLKIFPAFFLLYFLRKRDLRAATGLAVGALATIGISVWAFGLELHRTYLLQVLPWAMRGDAMDPYALSPNSISALLHKLFIFESQWNPCPVVHAPAFYALLHPLLQLLVLAPAIYLTSPTDRSDDRLQLEWSTFLVALLTVSTLPASYHFTLLILPIAVLAALFLRKQNYGGLTLLGILYVGIGFPAWPHPAADGWRALMGVPRLYLLLLLCGVCYLCLSQKVSATSGLRTDRKIWTAAFAAMLVIQVASTLRHQRGIFDQDHDRVALPAEVLSASTPLPRGEGLDFIAMTAQGYYLGVADTKGVHLARSTADQLSHAVAGDDVWVEEARQRSDIVRLRANGDEKTVLANAESPVVSYDGKWLAYFRDVRGTDALWLRALSDESRPDTQLTPGAFDVDGMTFLPDGSLIFAAEQAGHDTELYHVKPGESIRSLHLSAARYPAASGDGQWLAYSRLDRGVWNLWLQNLASGQTRRITSADCNDISPAWLPDSKTLVYASDCGRALWFTALIRRRVLP